MLDTGVTDEFAVPQDAERQAEATLMAGPVAQDVRAEQEARAARAEQVSGAVVQRLGHAIAAASRDEQHWAKRARCGNEGARLQRDNRRRELEALQTRRNLRLAELEAQRVVRPKPLRLVGSAIVFPACLLYAGADKAKDDLVARKASEQRGMDAVMAIERWLGHAPEDVSRLNVGWDIESRVGQADGTEDIRFIESKGVHEDADTVTLSANEVRQAAGNRDTFVLAVTKPAEHGTATTYYHGAIRDDYNPALDSYPFKLKALGERAESSETFEIECGACRRRN